MLLEIGPRSVTELAVRNWAAFRHRTCCRILGSVPSQDLRFEIGQYFDTRLAARNLRDSVAGLAARNWAAFCHRTCCWKSGRGPPALRRAGHGPFRACLLALRLLLRSTRARPPTSAPASTGFPPWGPLFATGTPFFRFFDLQKRIQNFIRFLMVF